MRGLGKIQGDTKVEKNWGLGIQRASDEGRLTTRKIGMFII